MGTKLIGTGSYLPEKVLTNREISKMVDTDETWIAERTGIQERHIATSQRSADLAAGAARMALENIDPASIDLIITATVTPDMLTPYMSSILKKDIGLENARTFDINAACSGFVYGMWIADSLMSVSRNETREKDRMIRALVVGTERLSRITDWSDRNTCILFGDGAGAAVFEYDETSPGILSSFVKNYDDKDDVLICGQKYDDTPFSQDKYIKQSLDMKGTRVFRFAVSAVEEVISEVLDKTGLQPEDIDFYIPHQANMRIIRSVAEKLGQPLEKFRVNIHKTGNVSSATIPMALDELVRSGEAGSGDRILLAGFGGGLSAGACILEL